MAPKKSKKISLNEFLGDSSLGSWADEMDSLPSAPAMRTDDDGGRSNDRYGRRGDDFLSSRPDRVAAPPREDLPLPTAPPYTAFVGNLAFDLVEAELEDFFSSSKPKNVKIIRDRDEKPKGFGYVELEDLDGLKDALSKTGSSFAGRTIRVSVAEPPKERSGFGGGDDGKFDSPWRREGPLPDLQSRDSSRRRFDSMRSDATLPSVSEGPSDWRSTARPRAPLERDHSESSSIRRKAPGFPSDVPAGAADAEESWSRGSKFKPGPSSEDSGTGSRFSSMRGRGDMGPPKEEESDWRAGPRKFGRGSTSPSNSTPPTPQMGRRKLELLPRAGNASSTPSPLASPSIGASPSMSTGSSRSNPFGSAKPVDVTNREKEVAERLERDRELNKEKLSMSRTSSRTGTERPAISRTRSPPIGSSTPSTPSSPRPSALVKNLNPNVRPTLSFANAAANKEETKVEKKDDVEAVTEKVAEVSV